MVYTGELANKSHFGRNKNIHEKLWKPLTLFCCVWIMYVHLKDKTFGRHFLHEEDISFKHKLACELI